MSKIETDIKYRRMTKLLRDGNIIYELVSITHNAHKIVVEGIKGYIDYYPDTGVWEGRSLSTSVDPVSGFGLRQLIKYVQNN